MTQFENKLFFLSLLLFFLLPFMVFAQASDSANINLQVTSTCGNNSCDTGETISNCPSDCKAGGGGPIIFQIKNVIAGDITTNSADVSWLTTQFSVCQFFWGKTSEYEKETISETNYVTGHLIRLQNLDFSSNYHFKITCVDKGLEKDNTQDQQFSTLTSLSNVANFSAISGDKKITLSWENPQTANFANVKILRKTGFFPLNTADGTIIYEGSGNFFEDTNLVNGKTYFYSIFVKNTANNFSSGAIAYAIPYSKNIPAPVLPIIPVTPVAPVKPLPKPAVEKQITINDFNFYSQKNNVSIKNNKTIEVLQNTVLNVSADCEKFSGDKTVLVNLQNNGKTSSFILKQDGAQNSCNVSLTVPPNSGTYNFQILLVNSKNEVTSRINAQLKVLSKPQMWLGKIIAFWIYGLIILAMIFFTINIKYGKKQRF